MGDAVDPSPHCRPGRWEAAPHRLFFQVFWDKFALDSNGIFWTHRRSTPSPPTGNRRVGQPSQLLPPRLPAPEGGPSKVASGSAWSNEMRQNCFREKVSQSCGIFEGLGFALQNAGQKIRLDLCVFGTVRDKVWGKSAPPPPATPLLGVILGNPFYEPFLFALRQWVEGEPSWRPTTLQPRPERPNTMAKPSGYQKPNELRKRVC